MQREAEEEEEKEEVVAADAVPRTPVMVGAVKEAAAPAPSAAKDKGLCAALGNRVFAPTMDFPDHLPA